MDPEVSTAITVLSDMVAGVGFYTEMPEDVDPDHPNKVKVDEWCEDQNLDEVLKTIVQVRYEYGFCPVQGSDLMILQPEYFWIHINKFGQIIKYSQRRERTGSEITSWKPSDIIFFTRKATPSNPYGEALIAPIIREIQTRNDVMEEVPDVIANIAYPFRVFVSATKAIGDQVYQTITEKGAYENCFFDDIRPDELTIHELAIDPRFNPAPFLDQINFQISEGLFAPLLMYLRNATEASATKMLESIDRHVEGEQRYFKRRVERYMYRPLVGEPVPRHIFGPPSTGLEEITLTDMSSLLQTLLNNRIIDRQGAVDLLGEWGIEIPQESIPEEPERTILPIPVGEKDDMEMALNVLEQAYLNNKVRLTEVLKEADKIINVYVDRGKMETKRLLGQSLNKEITELNPETERYFTILRQELFHQFKQRMFPTGVKDRAQPRTYHITLT